MKLSIQEFRIKKKILKRKYFLFGVADALGLKELSSKLLKEYEEIEFQLFKEDLSLIPSYEWDYVYLSGYYKPLDIKSSYAHLINSKVKFKSGSIIDLGKNDLKSENILKFHDLDEDNLSILGRLPIKFRESMISKSLTMEDFCLLDDELLNLLDLKFVFLRFKDERVYFLLDKIGMSKAVLWYRQDREAFQDILCALELSSFFVDKIHESISLEEASELAIKFVFNSFQDASENISNVLDFCSNNFKSRYKELFPPEDVVPKRVMNRLYSGKLTINDVIEYGDKFKEFDLGCFFDYRDISYISYKLEVKLQDLILRYSNFFSKVNSDYFYRNLFKRIAYCSFDEFEGDKFLNFNKKVILVALQISKLDFVKSINMFEDLEVEYVPILSDKNLMNISYKTYIKDCASRSLLEVFKLDYLKRLEVETHIFTIGEIIQDLANYCRNLNGYDCLKVRKYIIDYDTFLDVFVKMLLKLKKDHLLPNLSFIEGDFREKYKELFIDKSAPLDLQVLFYNGTLEASDLVKHPEWVKYIEGKDWYNLINYGLSRESFDNFFNEFGKEEGVKVLSDYSVQVFRLKDNIKLLKLWYSMTGKKFIPCSSIMLGFDINEISSFLENKNSWARIYRISECDKSIDQEDALFKISYSFGLFNGDKRGINQLEELFLGLPKVISEKEFDLLFTYEIDNEFISSLDSERIKFKLDYSTFLIPQIYKRNKKGFYQLKLNRQVDPYLTKEVRDLILNNDIFPLFTLDFVHKVLGRMDVKYDADFREFFVSNLALILGDKENYSYLASIQKEFDEIKAINRNRRLTYSLALGYVKTYCYKEVMVGNDELAVVSSIAGYTQADFDKLQVIYNAGKRRVFSSIPRIEGSYKDYSYEILRLDDPLAVSIGTLTTCCQEIGNLAESSMIHSVVSEHGRIFVVRNINGEILAQSWVWRNQNVICFDNIEIPEKQLDNNSDKQTFVKDILALYKKASEELILIDRESYQELYSKGKISERQLEGVVLREVTTGLDNSDISDVIEDETSKDKNAVSPIPFECSLLEDDDLYLDSYEQYILAGSHQETLYQGDTPLIYFDKFPIYDSESVKENHVHSIHKFKSLFDEELTIEKDVLLTINYEYGEDFKMIITSSFVIIYEESDELICILDLLFDLNENEDKSLSIMSKMYMAFMQISNDKDIELDDDLSDIKKEMYNNVMIVKDYVDINKRILR